MIEIAAYYDKSIEYPEHQLDTVLSEVSGLESRHVKIVLRDSLNLSREQMERAVDDIRRIKPQSRGSVVASGGKTLPISGSKKLNLQNTPVILVTESNGSGDSKPIYVFPCKVGERYYRVLDGISFLRKTLPNLVELPGEMEETIATLLREDPVRLESGLVFRSAEDFISTGKTDLVFTDANGSFLIVEVEREATDSAIGQILRLSAGFEKDQGLPVGSVRSSIACFRINENVLAAANRAKIEVWKLQEKSFRKVSM
ncbi:MAG: endonuclease NucS [Thaumarchaeota archaeon]|nr:endonuclease NucS [Nitrososphaerota archaeon]